MTGRGGSRLARHTSREDKLIVVAGLIPAFDVFERLLP
jgi:hypothetical protein